MNHLAKVISLGEDTFAFCVGYPLRLGLEAVFVLGDEGIPSHFCYPARGLKPLLEPPLFGEPPWFTRFNRRWGFAIDLFGLCVVFCWLNLHINLGQDSHHLYGRRLPLGSKLFNHKSERLAKQKSLVKAQKPNPPNPLDKTLRPWAHLCRCMI